MPGDGSAGGKKVTRFSIDKPGFSRLLPSAREGQSGFSNPKSPNVAKSLFKYEDILQAPSETLNQLYAVAGLNGNCVKKVRLETTKVIHERGRHVFTHPTNKKELIWYDRDQFMIHLRVDTNRNQTDRLSREQRLQVADICASSLQYFGYSDIE